MIDTALYFLHRVALLKPDNQFAKAIYNRFKNAGDNVNLKTWKLLDIQFDDATVLEESNPILIERQNKDYRFLQLYLKSFRKFPNLPENEYYGISFSSVKGKIQIPESTLLQGGNGTGKTSVFGALEYLFTGRMSAANKLGYKTKQQLEDYLCFAGGKKEDIDITVVTKTLTFSQQSDNPQQKEFLRLCLFPFFCSEHDVDKVIDEGVDIFVYEQMGYTLVRDIINKLDDEITTVAKQFESIENGSKDLETRIGILDKKVVLYNNLKSSVSSLAVKMRSVSKPKKELEDLKKFLKESYVLATEADFPKSTKHFTVENLEKEKEAVKKAMGKKAFSHYMEQLYSHAVETLQTEPEQPDKLPLPSITPQKENLTKVMENVNFSRNCFFQIVEDLLKLTPEQFSDIASWVEQYDSFLKNKEEELQQARDVSETANKVKRIVDKKAIFEEFLDTLKAEVYGTIDTLTSEARDLVNGIMEIFMMKGEKMALKYDNTNGEFSMDITFHRADGRNIGFSPEKYLNTFRYKLYCMALKMSIAFAMKKFYQMNFPIILDDIFYSSDFTHRSMVRDYFLLLFDKHRKLFPKDDLQIIFFTHDDMVIEAAYRGICDVTCGLSVNRQVMFDYQELDNPKKEKILSKDENGQPKTIKIKMRKLAYMI